jgi:hypothetical protein
MKSNTKNQIMVISYMVILMYIGVVIKILVPHWVIVFFLLKVFRLIMLLIWGIKKQ